MAKVSVVVLADTESYADMGRLTNALALVKEAVEAGDEAELVFDGAGVRWGSGAHKARSRANEVFGAVRVAAWRESASSAPLGLRLAQPIAAAFAGALLLLGAVLLASKTWIGERARDGGIRRLLHGGRTNGSRTGLMRVDA